MHVTVTWLWLQKHEGFYFKNFCWWMIIFTDWIINYLHLWILNPINNCFEVWYHSTRCCAFGILDQMQCWWLMCLWLRYDVLILSAVQIFCPLISHMVQTWIFIANEYWWQNYICKSISTFLLCLICGGESLNLISKIMHNKLEWKSSMLLIIWRYLVIYYIAELLQSLIKIIRFR